MINVENAVSFKKFNASVQF